jgi:putative ABC transport system permease protein
MNLRLGLEYIRIAVVAIRSQMVRASLTMAIIAVGIMALVGILTAIEAVKDKITSEFSRLGSNTFTVISTNSQSRGQQRGIQEKRYEPISYTEALQFSASYEYDALTSISANGSMNAIVKHKSNKTEPNVRIIGGDQEYLDLSGYEIESGRDFSPGDIDQGLNVVILGKDVQDKIFSAFENPVGKEVSIGSDKYIVIGTLLSKGNSMGFSGDNQCIIPVSSLRKNFASEGTNYAINVLVKDPEKLEEAINEATGLLRIIRKDPFKGESSTEIVKSDNLASKLIESIGLITIIATAIGFITLLGAGIGLMNIMLVSVTERTREIGVRKAIGASSSAIRRQFLIESVLISQLGGLFGLILGLLMGNIVATLIGAGFTIPWGWMLLGIVMCFIVGVASGYYPAKKASELDPIEALRYE